MDDLRLVQDLHGFAYDWWRRREEDRARKAGTLSIVDLASRLGRSTNNATAFITFYTLRRPQVVKVDGERW
jgi:hypothetical protein